MLDGLAIRFTDGYAAGASLIKQALRAYRDQTSDHRRRRSLARDRPSDRARHLRRRTWHDLVRRSVELARDRGALGVLPLALSNLAFVRIFEGDSMLLRPCSKRPTRSPM